MVPQEFFEIAASQKATNCRVGLESPQSLCHVSSLLLPFPVFEVLKKAEQNVSKLQALRVKLRSSFVAVQN